MPWPIKNYILLVDIHGPPSRRRNTAGRYQVGAKSKKEAIAILRELIIFGDIKGFEIPQESLHTYELLVAYKQAVKIEIRTGKRRTVRPARQQKKKRRKYVTNTEIQISKPVQFLRKRVSL